VVEKLEPLMTWKREATFESVSAVNGNDERDDRQRRLDTVLTLIRAGRSLPREEE